MMRYTRPKRIKLRRPCRAYSRGRGVGREMDRLGGQWQGGERKDPSSHSATRSPQRRPTVPRSTPGIECRCRTRRIEVLRPPFEAGVADLRTALLHDPPADEMGCAHEEHLVSAVYQDHRGEQQCKSLPWRMQP